MTNNYNQMSGIFHALADTTRRAVLQRLSEKPASVSELAKPFDMALPTFVQHLKVLESSGLIRSEKVGRVRTCEMVPDALKSAEEWIADRTRLWEQRLDALEVHLSTKSNEDTKGQANENE